jgi:hypothetical protein
MYFWYYRQTPAVQVNGAWSVFWPDAILGGSLDGPTAGNPGLGFSDYPYATNQYGTAVGFFPDLIPYTPQGNRNPSGGFYFPGSLESTTMDAVGPRMHTPRIARNPYGYLDPATGSGLLQWNTYLYYNDQCLIPDDPVGCSLPGRFAVSLLTITEQ